MSPLSALWTKHRHSLSVAALLLLAMPVPALQAQATGLDPAFVENRGQWPGQLDFGSRQEGVTSWFTQDGIHLLLEQLPTGWDTALIRHRAAASSRAGRMETGASRTGDAVPMKGHSLFLRPMDRSPRSNLEATGGILGLRHELKSKQVLDIPRHEGLRYRGIWPGVDLRFGHADGRLEYELDISAGVDLQRILFVLEGADRLWIGQDGALHAATSLGTLVQSSPRAFVGDGRGGEREIAARFVLLGDTRFGFEVEGWNGVQALRIDPGISWAGYVGGTAYDGFNAVCNRSMNNLVAVGFAYSWNYPVSTGAYQTRFKGLSDVVVVKRTAQGRLLAWATYIGGSLRESAFMVDCDSKGQVVLGGWTSSRDFPVVAGALQAAHGGGTTDAFLSKLDTNGRKLLFSTYLGGKTGDVLYGLQVDSRDRVYVCGETSSTDFPVTKKTFGLTPNGKLDAFVGLTNALGTGLIFSGFAGGKGTDGATNLSLDEARNRLFVCGTTNSTTFPVSKVAYDRTYNGGILLGDAFVMTLPINGAAILAASYLGGAADDTPWGIDVDPLGNPVLSGDTFSSRFPTTNGVVMPNFLGLRDAFVTRLSPMLNTLLMSTFFGGGLPDGALGIDVEADGKIRISGSTFSNGALFTLPFPTTAGAYRRRHSGGEDAFVVRLDAKGRLPIYSSLYGGSGHEWFYTDARNEGSLMPVAGISFSSNFPVSKPGGAYRGNGDGLLALVDPLPLGASLGGTATSTCAGEPTLLPATWPRANTPNFLLLAGRAPPKRPGIMLLGTASTKPITFAGAAIWLNLGLPLLAMPLVSDQDGEAGFRLPLPPRKGLVASLQLCWLEPASCARPLSATRYLRLVLQ